jgi:hypothetical protein
LRAVHRDRDEDGVHLVGLRLRTEEDRSLPGLITQATARKSITQIPVADGSDGYLMDQTLATDGTDGYYPFFENSSNNTLDKI